MTVSCSTPRALLAALLALGTLAGCVPEDGPRRTPFPRLDPSGPFAELAAGGQRGQASAAPAERSRFDEVILAGRAPSTSPQPTTRRQVVRIAGGLQAEIPLDFDRWRWAHDGRASLIVYGRPGGRPEALVYAEVASRLADSFPSVEVKRFQLTVDPSATAGRLFLAQLLRLFGPTGVGRANPAAAPASTSAADAGLPGPAATPPPASGLPEPEVAPPPLSEGALAALQGCLARTLGQGLGFASAPRSFTGWRWVGRNRSHLEVRLGRNRGVWGAAAAPPSGLRAALSQVAGAGWDLCRQRSEVSSRTSVTPFPAQPASLVWGSATQPELGAAVHLAVLCTQSPACPVARDLAHLLDTLGPTTQGAVGGASGAQPSANLPELAAQAGFRLVPLPVVLGTSSPSAL